MWLVEERIAGLDRPRFVARAENEKGASECHLPQSSQVIGLEGGDSCGVAELVEAPW